MASSFYLFHIDLLGTKDCDDIIRAVRATRGQGYVVVMSKRRLVVFSDVVCLSR